MEASLNEQPWMRWSSIGSALLTVEKAKHDDDWNDRYDRSLCNSHWGHNLMYMSQDIWVFATEVEDGNKDELFKALWVLMDLAVIAMFGPIGNNYDEPSLADA
jgi:hypothetical protein